MPNRNRVPERGKPRRGFAVAGGVFAVFFLAGLLPQFLLSGSDAQVVMPGEFEQQEAMLLAWDDNLEADQYESLASIIAACQKNVDVLLLVPNAPLAAYAERLLEERGVKPGRVEIVESEVSLPWIRDFGPLLLKRFDGRVNVLDPVYASNRPVCEDLPRAFAQQFGMQHVPVRMMLPGGNVMSNGSGLYLTTNSLVKDNAEEFQYDKSTVTSLLAEHLGATDVVYLESLIGEPTGHVDLFAVFTAPDVVVVGQYDHDADPVNAEILDRNAERLRGLETRCGPLRVVRIPMPPRKQGSWWSYTNVVFANGLLIMPTFADSDAELEARALATYRELLKGWRIETVEAAPLMRDDGGPRCATMNLYRTEAVLE